MAKIRSITNGSVNTPIKFNSHVKKAKLYKMLFGFSLVVNVILSIALRLVK